MGNACVENKQVAEEVSETIEHHGSKAADVTQAAKDAAEAAQRAAAQVAKDIDEKGIAQAAQEAAKAAADAAASAAAAALDAAKVAAKEVAEAASTTMDAAVAAVTGVMSVVFVNEKGAMQKVDFKKKKIGMSFALGGSGCCGPVGPAKVVVTSVDTASQAETLGVKPKWSIKAVNGVEVTGFSSAEKLLKEGAAKLSDA
mmetsp:Transcript_35968/g.116401  ORF Transcript_35968/g.116401 Transcript_35968/m.116401 type:complete len:200 (+) Transcript_35968:95-694(+)